MGPDDFSELARSRHSVRAFRPDPIPDDILGAVLDDARFAPSWSNTRPYCVAVASGERADRLRRAYAAEFDAALPMYHRRPLAFVRAVLAGRFPDGDFPTWRRYPDDLRPASAAVGAGLYEHLGVARSDRAARDAWNRANCEFFGAPTVLFVFVHRGLLPFSAHDAGLMVSTLMLSARAHGLGSCALGVLATWRRPVDAEFAVPPQYKLVTGLALGYASDARVNDFRAEHPPLRQAPPRR